MGIWRDRRFGRRDPQRDLAGAVAERGGAVAEAGVAERRERGVVEALGACDVAHSDRDMVEHGFLPLTSLYNRLESYLEAQSSVNPQPGYNVGMRTGRPAARSTLIPAPQ